jgi:hypothetical protein
VKAALQLAGIDLPATIEANTNALALTLVEGEAGAAIIDEIQPPRCGPGRRSDRWIRR